MANVRPPAPREERPAAARADLAAELQAEVAHLTRLVAAQEQEIADLRRALRGAYQSVRWRLGSRYMATQVRLARVALFRELHLIARRTLEVGLEEGVGSILGRCATKVGLALRGRRFLASPGRSADAPAGSDTVRVVPARATQAGRAAQSPLNARSGDAPLVSVLAVLPSADEHLLCDLLAAVEEQAYPQWELCVAVPGGTTDLVRGEHERLRVVGCVRATYADAFHASRGEVIALLGAGDRLEPGALSEAVARLADAGTEVVYSDEDVITASGECRHPFFKPGWSPDLLLSMGCLDGLVAIRRRTIQEAGGFSADFGPGQCHDLMLRVSEAMSGIAHIPKVLYHRSLPRPTDEAVLARYQLALEERLAIERALCRRGYRGTARTLATPWGPRAYSTRLELEANPLVSIIIPTRDKPDLLRRAIDSIQGITAYRRYEILVVDNGSTDPDALAYLDSLRPPCHVRRWPDAFNYAAINNFGVEHAAGEQILFLNNDVEIGHPDWLEALLEHAQRPEVGAVGAKLLYPDGRIQHAGVLVGIHGPVVHAFRGWPGRALDRPRLADVVRNCSAVTGACMMVPRVVFDRVGGFDPEFRVAFNDVDLCLRIREQGLRIVYTPHASLVHLEGATRNNDYPEADRVRFEARWAALLARGDPYYNPALSGMPHDWALPPSASV